MIPRGRSQTSLTIEEMPIKIGLPIERQRIDVVTLNPTLKVSSYMGAIYHIFDGLTVRPRRQYEFAAVYKIPRTSHSAGASSHKPRSLPHKIRNFRRPCRPRPNNLQVPVRIRQQPRPDGGVQSVRSAAHHTVTRLNGTHDALVHQVRYAVALLHYAATSHNGGAEPVGFVQHDSLHVVPQRRPYSSLPQGINWNVHILEPRRDPSGRIPKDCKRNVNRVRRSTPSGYGVPVKGCVWSHNG